jgi:hypothetical protein
MDGIYGMNDSFRFYLHPYESTALWIFAGVGVVDHARFCYIPIVPKCGLDDTAVQTMHI